MPKTIPIIVNNFSGGVSDSHREKNTTKFAIAKHFDIFSDASKLTPYRTLALDVNDNITPTGMKQYFVKDFVYASASSKIYGLGKTAGGLTKIVYRTDATTGIWLLPPSSEGNGAVKSGCLVEYKDYLWGFQGSTSVFKWGLLSGTPTITNAAGTVATISSVAQGVIAKDDNLYLPYNNKLVRVNAGGTVQDAVLTLPTNFKITSICNFGNYLAIACAPISTFNGASKVFLWNLTSTDVQEAIDWGEGELRILETVEGYLVGVTDRYLNNVTGADKGSMIIQIYQGGSPQVVKEVFTQDLTGKVIPISKVVKNNRLFFAAKIMDIEGGSSYSEGIWSFGRKNANYPFALSLDIVCEEADSVNGIESIGVAGNYFFISHSGDGSISKTENGGFSYTSIYESQLLNFGDLSSDKTLLSIKVSFRRLIYGESLTVKYRWDEEKELGIPVFTTVGSFSTEGKTARTFLNIESTGLSFASGKELMIRLESTGGLEITGLSVSARVNDTP